MRRFLVGIPVTAVAYVEVDAEDEAAAMDAAFEADWSVNDLEDIEAHRQVVRGNVSAVRYNEVFIAEDMGEA